MPHSVLQWLKQLFHRRPLEMTGIPEVLGRIDDAGKQQPVLRGWIKHDSLSQEQVRRVARLRKVLRDAYPMTMEGWIDGFMRDANPESEIQIMEACASAYQQLSTDLRLTSGEKQKLYAVLCAISAGTSESKLENALPVRRGFPDIQTISGVLNEAWGQRRRP